MQRSVNKYTKKQIHQGTAISQGKIKKHLPVMNVCEHQVQLWHTFCRVYAWLYGQDDISSTVQIVVIFVS